METQSLFFATLAFFLTFGQRQQIGFNLPAKFFSFLELISRLNLRNCGPFSSYFFVQFDFAPWCLIFSMFDTVSPGRQRPPLCVNAPWELWSKQVADKFTTGFNPTFACTGMQEYIATVALELTFATAFLQTTLSTLTPHFCLHSDAGIAINADAILLNWHLRLLFFVKPLIRRSSHS